MSKKRFTTIIVVVVLLSLIWVILTPSLFPEIQASTKAAAVHKGFQAPDFTLQTPEGQSISLSDYEGQPVLVFLWASWCSICKRTMPGLQSVYEEFAPEGFEILAINTSFQDSLTNAESYFESQGYTYTMLLDQDGSLSRDYQLHAVPLSVLVGPEGEVVDVIIGSGMSEAYLRAKLNEIFGERD
ncbi:MAG: TlpA disulfide reductase family protein [Brevefilum sp.]|nr:TlpA disulfide reductase family protein [Brevefilum sp.]MDT8380870.1 TlpA disulfide reductase family protein [Brevefilum sp.]MDW7754868.1 TlpA disulfide reductase family protein [Brevefilum sp.]